MKSGPVRFLALVVGGWIGLRAVMLLPDWLGDSLAPTRSAASTTAAASSAPARRGDEAAVPIHADEPAPLAHWRGTGAKRTAATVLSRLSGWVGIPMAAPRAPALFTPQDAPIASLPALAYPPLGSAPPSPLGETAARPSRWSGSAWLLWRDGGSSGLAPGGTLGGSQGGARLAYRLNEDVRRPLSLSGRLYLPVERPQGAEVALGLDWRPVAALPLHILAERRERIGDEGRSDFALTLYGGTEARLLRGRVRVEAYGQAGIVGIEEGDLFADGFVRAGVPVGPAEVGAGAWGGAQPGAERLDVGPQATFRLPAGRVNLRASAEWRFRVAGDAAPGSGPALTIAADF